MNRLIKPTFIFFLLALAIFLTVSTALARSQGIGYDLFWWTVDGGGATSSTGDGYSLGGTAGQSDASVWAGSGYALAGGFWRGTEVAYRVFLPLALREQ
jgi:hypothetical protein